MMVNEIYDQGVLGRCLVWEDIYSPGSLNVKTTRLVEGVQSGKFTLSGLVNRHFENSCPIIHVVIYECFVFPLRVDFTAYDSRLFHSQIVKASALCG